MMQVIQPGLGNPRSLVVCYLVDATILGPKIREALGPSPCVVCFGEGHAPETISQTIAHASTLAHFDDLAELVLVGFSLGCSGVREVLLKGTHDVVGHTGALEHLAGVVAIDGTHASMPPADWQIATWRTEFDAARAGGLLFVASHTEQTYVEKLTGGQAFTSTVNVLRRITSWELADAGPVVWGKGAPDVCEPVVRSEGNAFVYSCSSKTIDGAAHISQAQVLLPHVLAKHVRPMLDRHDTDPAPPEAA